MPRRKATSQTELEDRLDRVEELLTVGFANSKIAVRLSAEYGVSRRQAQRWIETVNQRWAGETKTDAPFRRERFLRKTGRFYAKSLSEKKYSAAASALATEAKLVLSFAQRNPELERMIDALGPPPKDPTSMLLYAQQLMAIAFRDVVTNPVLDERRLRWIVEFVKAFGMTHAKALFEQKLQIIEERLGLADGTEDADEGQPRASGDTALRARAALPSRKPRR